MSLVVISYSLKSLKISYDNGLVSVGIFFLKKFNLFSISLLVRLLVLLWLRGLLGLLRLLLQSFLSLTANDGFG